MNEVFYRGFVKEALKPGHLQLGAGAALLAIALYDNFKGRNIPTMTRADLSEKGVPSRAFIQKELKKKPLKRVPIVVTKINQLDKALQGTSYTAKEKARIRRVAKESLDWGHNAWAVSDRVKDILITPPKVSKYVLQHEIGHLHDIEKNPEQRDRPGILRSLLAFAWKPSYKKMVMEPEERAWAGIPSKKMKEKAMGTHEKGFHKNRERAAAMAALASFAHAAHALRRP